MWLVPGSRRWRHHAINFMNGDQPLNSLPSDLNARTRA